MRPYLLVAGACAAALFGAVTGATITTQPLDRGLEAWDRLPHSDPETEDFASLREHEALPDHYPLTTPQGRFEVYELRDRGLYRNRRFGSDSFRVDGAEPAYELTDSDYRYIPDEDYKPAPATRSSSFARTEQPPQDDQPLVLAAAEVEPLAPPPVAKPAALAGAPRLIDVSAELAARR